MNKTSLIKIASQYGYDLSPRLTDDKGNHVKMLVPTDYSRKEPLKSYEFQYPTDKYDWRVHANPMPKIVSPTMAGPIVANMTHQENLKRQRESGLYDTNKQSWNVYKKKGIVTPVKNAQKFIDNFDSGYPRGTQKEVGMLDLHKLRVNEMTDPNADPRKKKLIEAIVTKGEERARQARYNLLSGKDKEQYDAAAKHYRFNPHYSSIALPNQNIYEVIRAGGMTSPDILYYNYPKESKWYMNFADARRSVAEGTRLPIAYNANATMPGYRAGSAGFKLNGYDDGTFNEKYLEDPYVRAAAQGKIPVLNNTIPGYKVNQTSMKSGHYPYFMSYVDPDRKISNLSGINLDNASYIFSSPRYGVANDDSAGYKNTEKRLIPDVKSKGSVLAHEARHYTGAVKNPKTLDLFIEALNDENNGYGPEIKELKSKLKDVKDLDELQRISDEISRLEEASKVGKIRDKGNVDGLVSSNYHKTKGTLVPGYAISGNNEHRRAFQDLKDMAELYLAEIIPPQMEARGELDGMTEDEQIDAISDRVLDVVNDDDSLIEIFHHLGIGDDFHPDWAIPEYAIGNKHPHEIHRAIQGLGRGYIPTKGRLRKYINDKEERKKLDNPEGRDYRPLFNYWIKLNNQLFANNGPANDRYMA